MPGMKNCVIDWESFWSDNISVVGQGVPNYTAASDGYIVSVCVDGKGYCGTRAEMGPMLEQLAADPTVRPVACNANFDAAWHNKYFTPFKQEWFCLLDLAAFHQMPRNLAMLAGVVLGHKVEKATRDEMKGVRYETLSAEEQGKVQQYCLNDSVKEMEILERLPPMSPLEEKVAAHTRLINRRGVQINVDLVEEDKTRLETMRFHAFKKIPWHADAPPLSYPQLVKYCGSRNISVPASLAKTDENCSDMMALNPELAELVGFMRRYRRSNTMLKKIESLTDRVTPEGVLPLDFLYCGAPHTRRWSCKGVNLQNLDKEPLVTLAATATEPAQTVWTRNWIIPRPGKIFYIADYSQVEPRVLNWLAGNEAMLAAMRAGYSIYEAFAIQAEGWKGQPGSIKTDLGKKKYTLLKNRCVAEGTLVLTDRGYKPIQSVLYGDRVWDGVAWVTHEGIISQGQQPVIEKGNEYFTADHGIYCGEHSVRRADALLRNEEAAAMAWRKPPGSEWADLWKVASAVARNTAREGAVIGSLLVSRLWHGGSRGLEKLTQGAYNAVRGLWHKTGQFGPSGKGMGEGY